MRRTPSRPCSLPLTLSVLASALASSSAFADAPPLGAPPPDAKALVVAPKAADEPKFEHKSSDETNATISAGGQLATGNSQLLAGTANGKFEMRRDADGFGASLIGNYGQGAPAGQPQQVTAENLQGRVRYDRFLADRLSIFLIATGRHDRFQGLDFRTNLDPGVKYQFWKDDASIVWGEAGYDFQYDIRRNAARVQLDASGAPLLDANGTQAPLLDKTASQHSARLFLGAKHAFNSQVTFSTGLEYLQAFASSTPGMGSDSRLNYDALFAAGVGGGFSLGVGFSARYDHTPLPGKATLDTATTLNLIYSFSDAAPPAPTCPCPDPAAPPPPPPPPPDAAPPPPPFVAAPPAPANPPQPPPPPPPATP